MRKILRTAGLCLMIVAGLPLQSRAAELLVPVGKVIGLQLQNDTLTVAAYDDVFGDTARTAGLKIGDQIVNINGVEVSTAERKRWPGSPLRRECLRLKQTAALQPGNNSFWSWICPLDIVNYRFAASRR